ncbi:MAG: group I intron-associated PD-(D/E)XK endonuclease [Terriglobales bacterium]|jgi:hypothetical protein|nr:group I intron-associated PD-(D/E)XK endonuclease [Terriglobales bacterium]
MKITGTSIKHNKRRGEWAELRFMARASEHGFSVSKPWGDSEPYDFLVGHEGKFWRVQVKSTTFRKGHSYYCRLHGSHARRYTTQQIDFVAAYIIPKNIWFIFPAEVALRINASLILSPHMETSKNGEYEEAWHLMQGGKEQVPPLRPECE